MCNHHNVFYVWTFRGYCPDCNIFIDEAVPADQCQHNNKFLVNIVPMFADGTRLPEKDRLVYYCPDCDSYYDHVWKKADGSDEIKF